MPSASRRDAPRRAFIPRARHLRRASLASLETDQLRCRNRRPRRPATWIAAPAASASRVASAKLYMLGPNDHRRAGGERLDQVLAAERQEAAADHRHVARPRSRTPSRPSCRRDRSCRCDAGTAAAACGAIAQVAPPHRSAAGGAARPGSGTRSRLAAAHRAAASPRPRACSRAAAPAARPSPSTRARRRAARRRERRRT